MNDHEAIDEHIAALGKIFCAVAARLTTDECNSIIEAFKAGLADIHVESRISARDGIEIMCAAVDSNGNVKELFHYCDRESALVFRANASTVN